MELPWLPVRRSTTGRSGGGLNSFALSTLEEAVAAYRDALTERTRERVPLSVDEPRRARERDGAAQRGGRGLSGGVEGIHQRARAVLSGRDAEEPRCRAQGPGRAQAANTKRAAQWRLRLNVVRESPVQSYKSSLYGLRAATRSEAIRRVTLGLKAKAK